MTHIISEKALMGCVSVHATACIEPLAAEPDTFKWLIHEKRPLSLTPKPVPSKAMMSCALDSTCSVISTILVMIGWPVVYRPGCIMHWQDA